MLQAEILQKNEEKEHEGKLFKFLKNRVTFFVVFKRNINNTGVQIHIYQNGNTFLLGYTVQLFFY